MNKQGPGGIEWLRGPNGEPGYTWNPIKGLCPIGCWYCFARKMYKRFGWPFEISLDTDPIERWGRVPDGSRIFVCSTMEIFNSQIPCGYRDFIFENIEDYSKLTFIILTKMPERIDRPMPPNVWLGVSVTGFNDTSRIDVLLKAEARVKFISYEPLLSFPGIPMNGINWIIVGKLTGHGKKYDPPKSWIQGIVGISCGLKCPIFLKNNLREIWGPNLIQEFPK